MALPTEKTVETANKKPMGWALVVVTALLTTVANQFFKSTDGRNDDCKEQVERLWERVYQLEAQVDKYTTAIMAKDGQIKLLSDSLAKGDK